MASWEYTPLGGFESKTTQNRLLETTNLCKRKLNFAERDVVVSKSLNTIFYFKTSPVLVHRGSLSLNMTGNILVENFTGITLGRC